MPFVCPSFAPPHQSAIPTCSLTTPYVAADGLVWGGVNAGGSITTTPFATTGLPMTGTAVAAATTGTLGIGTGVFNQFVLPQFNSATCTFNISLGNTVRGGGSSGRMGLPARLVAVSPPKGRLASSLRACGS